MLKRTKEMKVLLVVGALALGATAAYAAVIFRNGGSLSGWSGTVRENRGTITSVSSPSYRGNTLAFTQVFVPGYLGRYHSEVYRNDGYRPGDTRSYGFAFFIPSGWQDTNQGFNIAQFIADFGNTGCDDWMPTTMMWIRGNQLSTRIKSGTVCSQRLTTFNNIATVTKNQWHTVVIQANWQSNNTGFFRVWFDGTKVLERLNVATTIADPQNRTFSFRAGMYANSWYDNGHVNTSSQNTRTWFMDNIAIGTTYADVNPSVWQ